MAVDGETVDWLGRALEGQLHPQGDLNALSSLIYPLTRDRARIQRYRLEPLLNRAEATLRQRREEHLTCGEAIDRRLALQFLAEAGIGDRLPGRVACESERDLFGMVNGLLLECRHGVVSTGRTVTERLDRLAARQGRSGAFFDQQGRSNYYLNSHATLALFYCGGNMEQLGRGQQWLITQLPRLYGDGELDALAENLIFLEWMGLSNRFGPRYRNYLLSRKRSDGGLCFRDRPGCRSHWHATSLLLELQRLGGEGR